MNKPFAVGFWSLVIACAAEAGDSSRYIVGAPPAVPAPFLPPWLPGLDLSLTHVAFAPGFRHAVFSAMDARPSGKVATSIHESRLRRAGWSAMTSVETLRAPESSSGEAAFTRDGRWLYFSSNRPPSPGEAQPRIFRARVRNGRIGTPELVPLAIPSDAGAYYPRLLAGGDLAFTSRGPNGGDDLFVARRQGRTFGAIEPLAIEPLAIEPLAIEPMGGDFNSPQDDWDLVETRDGRLRVWVSARAGGLGRTDLYYSRRTPDGTWSTARHLAAASTPALETAPALTPDDQALFFLRRVEGKERMYWVRLDAVLDTP